MKLGNGKKITVTALMIVALIAIAEPVHAQQFTERTTSASYVPGDTGSLVVTVVNDLAEPLVIKNITIYFPWATVVDGKWPAGANVSENFSPSKTLGTQSNNNTWTYSAQFTIPGWYGGNALGIPFGNCPASPTVRYGEYSGCVLLGTASSTRYQTDRFGIVMAQPVYTPQSLVSEWLPIATLAVLVVATAFLGMTWSSMRRMAKK